MADKQASTDSAAIQSFLPATFLERGAAVPFTTPALAGARVRPDHRAGLELIIPSPGGRGVYVLPWDNVSALCRPTVHDTRLIAEVSALRAVTPSAIRAVARSIAATGLAGRPARQAAEATQQAEEEARLVTNFGLLLRLVGELEKRDPDWVPPEQDTPLRIKERARRAIAQTAPLLGHTSEALANALEELSVHFCGIGVGPERTNARLPRLLQQLDAMRGDLRVIAENDQSAPGLQTEARMIADAADITMTGAATVMRKAMALTDRMAELLHRWLSHPAQVSYLIAQPEWLLDGWERICALWRQSDPSPDPTAKLNEMVDLLPVTPQEASAWIGLQNDMKWETQRRRRRIALMEDWRSGKTMMDIVARNEGMFAHAQ